MGELIVFTVGFIYLTVILLLPATIIRVLWRKRIPKKYAIGLCILSYFPFFIIFGYLGLEKTQNLIPFGVFTSYYIYTFATKAQIAKEVANERSKLGY